MDDESTRAVEISGEVRKISTMADGTVNVTINVPEYNREQIKVMLDWIQLEVRAVIEVMK